MKEFKAGDHIRGRGAYDPDTGCAGEMWGDMKYVGPADGGHTCVNAKGVRGHFLDDDIELWDKPIGFEVGDEATYMFDGGRPYRSGKVVEVNADCVHFEFEDFGTTGRVPFNFDGTGICRDTFPKKGNYGFSYPAPLTDGTDFGATLRLDKKAEKPLSEEQVLANELRTILARADEISDKLTALGFQTRMTNVNLDTVRSDRHFTMLPVEITRKTVVTEQI
jgi:hypothetical protein